MNARRTTIRPRLADASLVRLAPDGRRLAFVLRDGEAGIYLDDLETGPVRVARCQGWQAEELAWSPDGEHLAWVVGGPPRGRRVIGWTRTHGAAREAEPDGAARAPGFAFCWSVRGSGLFIADLERGVVVSQPVAGDALPKVLARIADDGDDPFPPRLAASPDGRALAFTSRRARTGSGEVWIVAQDDERPAARQLTEIPGEAMHLVPFWSPRGATLGVLLVHLDRDRSGIVIVPGLEGEGELLYKNRLIDPAECPAWSPDGRRIAFMHTPRPRSDLSASGPSQLALLDPSTRALTMLSEPGAIEGTPRWHDAATLVVDGRDAAHIFTPEAT